MQRNVSEKWEPFLRSEVRNGRNVSEDEVLDEALRMLHERRELEGAARTNGSEAAESPESSALLQRKPIWQVADELRESIPEEEWAKLPVDGAEQLDHYIYGSPKRAPA